MNDNHLPLLDLELPVRSTPLASAVIAPGTKVTLNFALQLADGMLVDGNLGDAPVSFIIGDGNMLPGFEAALAGKVAGERVDVIIAAEQAFGAVNPDNQQRFPRYRFPPTMPLSENLLVEFADAAGFKQAGRVVYIGQHEVEIDFNHPLAGRNIHFIAQIHQVEPGAAQP